MKKIFENVTRLTTKIEYDLLSEHLEDLIKDATEGGYLSDPDENNYTREIARLSALGGMYETDFMTFSFSKPRASAQREVARYRIRQNKAEYALAE
jgi:hypothetical protein